MKITIRSLKRLLAPVVRRIRWRRRISGDPRSISPVAIQSFVQAQYGLRAITKPDLMVTGFTSAVWRFDDREETCYVKAYRRQWDSLARIKEEAALCARLNQHGVRAPQVVATSAGHPVTKLQKGRETYNVTVTRGRQGREVNAATVTSRELSELGRAIARMHRLLAGYRPGNGHDFYSSQVNLPKRSLPELVRSPNRSLFTAHELQRFEALENEMLDYLERNLRSENLTQSILHGDLKLEHVQLCPDRGIYLVDFGDWHQGLVAWELGCLIQSLYVAEDAAAKDISFERFEALKDIFLSSYAEEYSLTANDREALSAFVMLRVIDTNRWCCWISLQQGRIFRPHCLRRGFDLAEYLLSRSEKRNPPVVRGLALSCTAAFLPLLALADAH